MGCEQETLDAHLVRAEVVVRYGDRVTGKFVRKEEG